MTRARPGHRVEHDLLGDSHRLTGTAGPHDATAIWLSAEPPTTITGGTP
jgi:hypothetical protein